MAITSRQPTGPNFSTLAIKCCVLATLVLAKIAKNTYRRLLSASAYNKRYHSLARKGSYRSVTTERYPTYSSSPHEELRQMAYLHWQVEIQFQTVSLSCCARVNSHLFVFIFLFQFLFKTFIKQEHTRVHLFMSLTYSSFIVEFILVRL